MSEPLITILGPTASGKTHLAVLLANSIDAEIISADSRQVYRGMDIGTGKDLNEYIVGEKRIMYHLIDIVDAGEKYNVYNYINDFEKAYHSVCSRNKKIILCGGSGMYIESVLKGYNLIDVPVDSLLRDSFEMKSDGELLDIFLELKTPHNTSDTKNRERLLRAIEIALHYKKNNITPINTNTYSSIIFGVHYPREVTRLRITERLKYRLENGMIEEVQQLLNNSVGTEVLMYYGLEYKFITQYLCQQISYEEMFDLLNTAIHQFAKRQMTWFRRMEKQGFNITWINGEWEEAEKLHFISTAYKQAYFS